jgi:HAD superfamily phosphoserine phosphatase-like hydrolase
MKRALTTAGQVLAAVDEALAAPAPSEAAAVAAFDADHTLWHADVGDLGWRACLEARLLKPASAAPLARELELVGARPSGEPHEDARALYALYKEDKVSEDAIVRAMTVCYAGWSHDEVEALSRRLARDAIARARYEGVAEIARGLRERGFRVVVVSGSPAWLVRESVRGFLPVDPEVDIFGTLLESKSGILGAKMAEPVTFFEGKVEALKRAFPGKRPSFAFGDSKGDVPLLEHAARLAFAVNPRPQLRKLAFEHERFRVFDPERTVTGECVRAPGTDRVIE